MRVDDPGHGVEIDVTLLAGDAFGHHDALFHALVRQHRAGHHVAHRPDVGQVGAAVVVDVDVAARTQFEADILGAEALRVGHAANRNDQAVALQGLGFVTEFIVDRDALLAGLDLGDLDASWMLRPCFWVKVFQASLDTA
jgi:hypothetical protein